MLLPVQWLRSKIAGRRPGDGVMRALLDGSLPLRNATMV